MASRNQNRPPRSPSNTVPPGKRRRVGAERTDRQGNTGRGRQPFASVNKGPEANRANDVVSTDGSDIVEFAKEDVEALLNEKFKKGNPFDNKKKMDQMGDYIRRLRLCVKWFQKLEESCNEEKEKLQSALESAEKQCSDTETEMKNKIKELSNTISESRKTIFSLEERISKEEFLKLESMERHREEKEARNAAEKMQVSLSTELEKIKQEKLEAEQKAKSSELLYNSSKEYNMDLQRYNSRLQTESIN